MKRGLLVILLLFLIIPSAFSLYEDKIFSGWAKSGDYFSVKDQTYRVIYVKNINSTVVYFPNGGNTVWSPGNESTKCVSDDFLYKVCQSGQRFEKNGKIVPQDIHDPYIDVFLNLEIWKSDVGVNMTRYIPTTDLFTGDTIEIRSEFSRVGLYDVTGIQYKDYYSDDFKIDAVSGCYSLRDRVVWSGDLLSTMKHVCIYRLTALRNTTFENNATVSYNVVSTNDTEIDKKKFTVETSPLDFDVDYNDKTMALNDTARINISIVPKTNVTLKSLVVKLPDSFVLVNRSDIFVSHGDLHTLEEMPLTDDLDLFIEASNVLQGTYNATVDFTFSYDNKIKRMSRKIPLTFMGPVLKVYYVQDKNTIRITNPNETYYRDIYIVIGNQSVTLPRLDANRFKEFPFLPLNSNVIEVKYRTVFGQILSFKQNLNKTETVFAKTNLSAQEDTADKTETNKGSASFIPESLTQNLKDNYQMYGAFIIAFVLGTILVKKFIFGHKKGRLGSLDKEIKQLKKDSEDVETDTKSEDPAPAEESSEEDADDDYDDEKIIG